MLLDLNQDDKSYVVINIDSITLINGFDKNDKDISGGNKGKKLDPQEKFKRILSVCLADETHFPPSKVYRTNHIDYFTNYLRYYDKEVGFYAETIVVEKQYMSLSYLTDYSKYYSIGYNSYDKFCKRIHFFQTSFDKNDFEKFINSRDSDVENFDLVKKIKSHYLGHIVSKPLPNSLIGATLLRAYDEFYENLERNGYDIDKLYQERNRNYFALRDYKINLFGQSISYRSLVFQEQDRAVSACATVAIWMCLHKLNELFRTPILAPIEITESAGLGENSGRNIPSQGLQTTQIIKAIDSVQSNLVSEIFVGKDIARIAIARQNLQYRIIKPWKVKRYIYAYLRLQIPVLLGYNFIRLNGNHLVTVTGYRFEKNTEERQQNDKTFPNKSESFIHTVADRIIRLYSHDDQLGPFSKIGFDNNGFNNYLKVNWRDKAKYDLAVAKLVVVPIIDFIRVNYIDIEKFAAGFQAFLEKGVFRESSVDKIKRSFVWDIYVIQSNDYKVDLRNNLQKPITKHSFQTKSYPQYIWIASLHFKTKEGDMQVCDFIFDATDTPKSMNLFDVLYFNKFTKQQLSEYIKKNSNEYLKGKNAIYNGAKYFSKITKTLEGNE